MKKYVVDIPLAATEFVTVEAESEDEALAKVIELVDNHEVRFDFDPEPDYYWTVEEEPDLSWLYNNDDEEV